MIKLNKIYFDGQSYAKSLANEEGTQKKNRYCKSF